MEHKARSTEYEGRLFGRTIVPDPHPVYGELRPSSRPRVLTTVLRTTCLLRLGYPTRQRRTRISTSVQMSIAMLKLPGSQAVRPFFCPATAPWLALWPDKHRPRCAREDWGDPC